MVKRSLFYVVGTAFFAVSVYFMPVFFLTAFNYGKGIQNNEDGILFIPLGFVLIIASVLADVLLVKKALKINRSSRRNQWIIAVVLVAISIVCVILTFGAWEMFFTCFAHFRGLNLELQT